MNFQKILLDSLLLTLHLFSFVLKTPLSFALNSGLNPEVQSQTSLGSAGCSARGYETKGGRYKAQALGRAVSACSAAGQGLPPLGTRDMGQDLPLT